jgi:hypothetical protein
MTFNASIVGPPVHVRGERDLIHLDAVLAHGHEQRQRCGHYAPLLLESILPPWADADERFARAGFDLCGNRRLAGLAFARFDTD